MSSNVSGSDALQSLEEIVIRNNISRYLTAVGFVILIYDHTLTFDEEVEEIWKAPWNLPKYLFLALRYMVPLAMTIQIFQMSDISVVALSAKCFLLNLINRVISCRTWFITSTAIGLLSIACSNLLVLFRLWAIWGRNRRLIYLTFTGFILCQLTALAFLTTVSTEAIRYISYNDEVRQCVMSQKVPVALLWAPGVAFEIMVFIATFWNAFDRPRGLNTTLLSDLHRDGFFYFLLLFILRCSNLTLAIVDPLSLLFVGVLFIWCSTTVTVTRLILKLRRVASMQRRARCVPDELAEDPIPMVTTERTRTLSQDNYISQEKS